MANHRARNQWQDTKKRVVETGLQMARDLATAQGRAQHAEALLGRALVRIARLEKNTLQEELSVLMEEFDGANSESPSGADSVDVHASDGETGSDLRAGDVPAPPGIG